MHRITQEDVTMKEFSPFCRPAYSVGLDARGNYKKVGGRTMAIKNKGRRFKHHRREAITSVQDFVADLFSLREGIYNEKLLFRGQSKAGDPLRPTIGRSFSYADNIGKSLDFEDEIQLLHRFRRRAFPLVGPITAGAALFLARHHGLPTRLLDWTAYVA